MNVILMPDSDFTSIIAFQKYTLQLVDIVLIPECIVLRLSH